MNLIRLTPSEAIELSYKVGDLHEFKSYVMKTNRELSRFDIFKDIDTHNKDIYVALKFDPYSNYEYSGYSLY